jgi:hypothetical protein
MLQTKLVESQPFRGARKMPGLQQLSRPGSGNPRHYPSSKLLDHFRRELLPRRLIQVGQAQTASADFTHEALRGVILKDLAQCRRSDPFPKAGIAMDPFADRHNLSLRLTPARFVAHCS